MSNFEGNLYDDMQACFVNALSTNREVRLNAEEKLKAYETLPEFGEHLTNIAVNVSTRNRDVRHMALVLLHQYLTNYWSMNESDQFYIPANNKENIKSRIVYGLRDSDHKIRNSFAYCISLITCKDKLDKWPHIFFILSENINSNNEYSRLGVLKTLELILLSSEEETVILVIPHIIQELSKILTTNEIFSLNVKNKAIHVLETLIKLLNKDGQELMGVPLTDIVEALVQSYDVLQDTVERTYEYCTTVNRFFHVLVKFNPWDPLHLCHTMCNVAPTVCRLAMTMAHMYRESITSVESSIYEAENEEGQSIGFTPLVLSIFDFMQCISETSQLKFLLDAALPEMVYYIITFMLITRAMEERWQNDGSTFLTEDTEVCYEMSVRVSANHLFYIICAEYNDELVIPALCSSLNRHLSDSIDNQNAAWKIQEVCQLTLGCIRRLILKHYPSELLSFDLHSYACQWHFLSDTTPVLLILRNIWFSAKYAQIYTSEMHQEFVNIIINYLHSDNLIHRLCAARSLYVLCERATANCNFEQVTLAQTIIADGLAKSLTSSQNHKFVTLLTLRTMNFFLLVLDTDLHKLCVDIENVLIPLMVELFIRHIYDIDIMKYIRTMLKEFCLNELHIVQVQVKFLPCLVEFLYRISAKAALGAYIVAIEFLTLILQHSKNNFSDILIRPAFPTVVRSILNIDDHLLIQNGSECIRWYLIIGREAVFNYVDANNSKNGLEHCLEVINKLLDPLTPETALKHASQLIITLIMVTGAAVVNYIYIILKALVNKLQSGQSLETWQNLITVFCFLFCEDVAHMVGYLRSVPTPTSTTALEFILCEWFQREVHFLHNSTEHKLSAIALCKILEYGVTSEEVFSDIVIHDPENKTAPVPVLMKAFQFIVQYLAALLPQNTSEHEEHSSSDSSDSSSESSAINDALYNERLQQLDPCAQDPKMQINELTYIKEFLYSFKNVATFNSFYNLLDAEDRQTLAHINIQF